MIPTGKTMMLMSVLALLALASVTVTFAQQPDATQVASTRPANLDFESDTDPQGLPVDWVRWGQPRTGYKVITDASVAHSGKKSAKMVGPAEPGDTFVGLGQHLPVERYHGKRVRLSGYIRTEGVGSRGAGLCLRVDGPGGGMRAFDNMKKRRVIGTTDWTRHEIVLDVLPEATGGVLGALLADQGTAWVDDLKLEVVGPDTPTTDLISADQTTGRPANLDFEEGNVGEVPPGWFVPTSGYRADLSGTNPKHGERCARLSESGEGERARFGNIMQSVRADEYRGKRVRLRAAIRAEVSGTNRAQMWFRVDREDRKKGFFDNMGDRPITNSTWEYYEIVGNVAQNAEHINFGLMLVESGSVWFDDVALEVLGDVAQVKAEPPRPLEGRGLDNLVAFTRLLGYVRHFHPSDQAVSTDWDAFAIAGVREIESAQSAEQLARALGDIFRPVAPTLRVYPTGRKPELPVELKLPADANTLDVIAWRHRGFGQGGTRQTYRSARLRRTINHDELPNDVPNPGEPFEADLSGGVSCMVPLGLFADEEGTIPHTTDDEQGAADSALVEYTGDDRATRLAGVALAWNIFQHFYPYFDVVETDWPAALRTALESAATDKDGDAFAKTLQRLVAGLHDGHGGVRNPNASYGRPLPLLWDWIENQLVITCVTSDADLQRGDVVLKIGGKPAADALAETEVLISAATMQWRRQVGLRRLLATNRDHVELEVRSLDGRMRTLVVKPVVLQQPLRESRPETVAEIRAGIMYVDVDRVTDDEFRAALPQLEKAKGIVFDFRGYPRSISKETLFPHIIATPVTSAQWHVPIIRFPDRANVTFDRGGEWYISPKTPYLEAQKAFITNGRAISYAESCLGIIEHYKLGEIVGGPTAGTNGNVSPFALPGGYRVTWTGMRVLKHDGSQHHGVGIRPTVVVSRTIKGVAEGKDELLERAIEIVSR